MGALLAKAFSDSRYKAEGLVQVGDGCWALLPSYWFLNCWSIACITFSIMILSLLEFGPRHQHHVKVGLSDSYSSVVHTWMTAGSGGYSLWLWSLPSGFLASKVRGRGVELHGWRLWLVVVSCLLVICWFGMMSAYTFTSDIWNIHVWQCGRLCMGLLWYISTWHLGWSSM